MTDPMSNALTDYTHPTDAHMIGRSAAVRGPYGSGLSSADARRIAREIGGIAVGARPIGAPCVDRPVWALTGVPRPSPHHPTDRTLIMDIGSFVTVRGTEYRIVGKRNTSGAGSKFFGKWSFTLRDADGNAFTAYGKTVMHNSRLTPVVAHVVDTTDGAE